MITGILLAAGRGKRLGGTKQMVPWPKGDGQSQPMIAAAFDAIAPVCDAMVVVLGHEAAQIESVLAPREFAPVHSNPDGQMIDSFRAGFGSLDEQQTAGQVLLQLADHPQVRTETLQRMMAASVKFPDRAIIPIHGGKGGHPVLIPSAVLHTINTASVDAGLKSFWEKNPACCFRLNVDDPSILWDIDTPADHRKFSEA